VIRSEGRSPAGLVAWGQPSPLRAYDENTFGPHFMSSTRNAAWIGCRIATGSPLAKGRVGASRLRSAAGGVGPGRRRELTARTSTSYRGHSIDRANPKARGEIIADLSTDILTRIHRGPKVLGWTWNWNTAGRSTSRI